jgi:hypothetical protein
LSPQWRAEALDRPTIEEEINGVVGAFDVPALDHYVLWP